MLKQGRKYMLALALTLGGSGYTAADNAPQPDQITTTDILDPGDGRIRGLKGYYYTDIDGEETKMLVLNEVTVFPPLKFKNKKQEQFYWRTVRDVKKTLPTPNSSARPWWRHTSTSRPYPTPRCARTI